MTAPPSSAGAVCVRNVTPRSTPQATDQPSDEPGRNARQTAASNRYSGACPKLSGANHGEWRLRVIEREFGADDKNERGKSGDGNNPVEQHRRHHEQRHGRGQIDVRSEPVDHGRRRHTGARLAAAMIHAVIGLYQACSREYEESGPYPSSSRVWADASSRYCTSKPGQTTSRTTDRFCANPIAHKASASAATIPASRPWRPAVSCVTVTARIAR